MAHLESCNYRYATYLRLIFTQGFLFLWVLFQEPKVSSMSCKYGSVKAECKAEQKCRSGLKVERI